MSKKWYLAGPMTGYPKFNFPAFDFAAKSLREQGYDVVSPAELDAGAVRDAALQSERGSLEDIPQQHSYGKLLSRDVALVIDDCEGIFLLEGWEKSRGARIEAFVGTIMGLEFRTVSIGTVRGEMAGTIVWPSNVDSVRKALLEQAQRPAAGSRYLLNADEASVHE